MRCRPILFHCVTRVYENTQPLFWLGRSIVHISLMSFYSTSIYYCFNDTVENAHSDLVVRTERELTGFKQDDGLETGVFCRVDIQ